MRRSRSEFSKIRERFGESYTGAIGKMFNRLSGPCGYPVVTRVKGLRSLRPCGQCLSCQMKKQNYKIGRSVAAAQLHNSAVLTLTISDDKLSEEMDTPEWWKLKIQKTIQQKFYRESGEYPLVRWQAEMGPQTLRPHAHVIVHKYPYLTPTTQERNLIVPWWKFGSVTIDAVTPASAGYVCGYVCDPEKEKLRIAKSQSRGIGLDYIRMWIKHMQEGVKYHGAGYSTYPDRGTGYLSAPAIEVNHRKYCMDAHTRHMCQEAGILKKLDPIETDDAVGAHVAMWNAHPQGLQGHLRDLEKDLKRREEVARMRAQSEQLNDAYQVGEFSIRMKDFYG